VPSLVTRLFAIAAGLLVPPLSVVGLVLWAGRLRRQRAARPTVWTAYGLAALAGLVIVAGMVPGVLAVTVKTEGVEPSAKARALADRISEAMNCGAFAMLIVLVGVAGLMVWSWWGRRHA
jgi:hypothetical protein